MIIKIYNQQIDVNDADVKKINHLYSVSQYNISAGNQILIDFEKLLTPQISIFCHTSTDQVKIYAGNFVTKNTDEDYINMYQVMNEANETDYFAGNSNPYFGNKKLRYLLIKNISSSEICVETNI